MKSFKSGNTLILVVTDMAGHGLDISYIAHVSTKPPADLISQSRGTHWLIWFTSRAPYRGKSRRGVGILVVVILEVITLILGVGKAHISTVVVVEIMLIIVVGGYDSSVTRA